MFKKCLENRVVRHEGDYKCYLCQCEIKQSFDLVLEHLATDRHKERLNQLDKKQRKNESYTLVEMSESQLRRIVENQITFDRCSVSFYCHVCKSIINELCTAFVHIREISHRLGLKKFNVQCKMKAKKVEFNNDAKGHEIASDKSSNSQASFFELQTKPNCIIYDEKTKFYYCNICKINIIDVFHVAQHKQGLLHQALESKLTNSTFNLKSDCIIYDEESSTYHCTICKCQFFTSPEVSEHVQGHYHQTMLIVENISDNNECGNWSQEVVNQIVMQYQSTVLTEKLESSEEGMALQDEFLESCFSKIDCCIACQAFLRDNTDSQLHVMIHLFKEFRLLNNFDVLQFNLGADGKCYSKCLLCDYYCLSDMSDAHQFLKEHFKTGIHLERLTFFKFTKNDAGLENMDEQINSIDLNKFMYNTAYSICPCLLCNRCDVPLPCSNNPPDKHASGKCSEKKAKNSQNHPIIENKTEFDLNDLHYYKCFMCNISFSDISILFEHYKTPEHKWKIEALKMIKKCSYTNFKRPSEIEIIRCSLCNMLFNDFKSTMEHILGTEHNEKLKLMQLNQENERNAKPEGLSVNLKILSKIKKDLASISKNQNNSVVTTKNSKKTRKVCKLEASVEELSQLGFGTENLQPISKMQPKAASNVLENLVSLDFSRSQIKNLPSLAKTKPPRAPKVEKQRNSFATNVLMHGKNFIKFCIDPGQDNIYNYDNEKISLLKYGVSLTFPHHSDRVCIPCGQQFLNDVQSLFEHLQNQEHLKNICDMLIYDEEFGDCPGQFSDLKLAGLYMHTTDKSILCRACNIEIEDNDAVIRKHVFGSIHKGKSKLWKEQSDQLFNQYLTIYKDIWYYAEVFFCEICLERCEFELDFVMHLKHPEHMKKVSQLTVEGTALTFDLCPSCITYWFGKTDSYELHCQSDFHKRFATSKDFMVPKLTITASEYLDKIIPNANLLIKESNKADLQKDKEIELLKAIVETVQPVYPDAKAYIFGSRLSQLGFPDSDADIFLDCENVYYVSSTKEQNQQCIKSIKNYFESTPNTWVVDEILLVSRIPIMKLRHIPTNLKCDISFTSGLSIEKSQLIGLYNRSYPMCRKLILFMKKWLTLCRLFGSDCITTFAISWCTIFYLQLRGVFPTVDELIKRNRESKIVDGWECGFGDTIAMESSNFSFKDYLKGFFTYFANFDYQKNVICPYLGRTISKHTFACTDELPSEMETYKRRLMNNEVEIFRFDSPMCIQDPIDLSQNLTKAVKKQHLRRFRQYCILSAEKVNE